MNQFDQYQRREFSIKNPLRISSINKDQPEKPKRVKKDKKYDDWVMPPEQERYIPHRKHDPL